MLLKTNPSPNVDYLASFLAYMGAFARSMPPSWDGARVAPPVCGPDGEFIGRMMPGRGLYLEIDPKKVGITRGKRIPHVYPKTPVQRLIDGLGGSERLGIAAYSVLAGFGLGAITTYDGIISGRAGGKGNDVATVKVSVATTANQWSSLARLAGLPGAMTFNSTTAPTDAVCDRSTAGAWSVGLSNPSGGDKKYLLTFGFASASQLNMAILHDLLVQGGSFRLTVNTEEAVTTPTAVNRQYTSTLGAGNLVTFVLSTANSTTSHTFTIKYTDQDGNANQTFTTSAITTATAVEGLYPITYGPFVPFASGDYGIRSLKSTQSSVALAAGVALANIYYPLAFVPGLAAGAYVERDSTIQVDGLTELVVTAGTVLGCLGLYVLPNGTTSGVTQCFFRTVAG